MLYICLYSSVFGLVYVLILHFAQAQRKSDLCSALVKNLKGFDKGKYVCAYHSNSLDSDCKSPRTFLYSNEVEGNLTGKELCIRTMIVQENCMFKGYYGSDFSYEREIVFGPELVRDGFRQCFKSYSCFCPNLYDFDCVAEEKYITIHENAFEHELNTGITREVPCNTSFKFGTEFAKDVQETLDFATRKEFFVMIEKLYTIFITSLGGRSNVTGYRWVSDLPGLISRPMSMASQHHMCPTNQITIIQQLVGECGETTVYTNQLKFQSLQKSTPSTTTTTTTSTMSSTEIATTTTASNETTTVNATTPTSNETTSSTDTSTGNSTTPSNSTGPSTSTTSSDKTTTLAKNESTSPSETTKKSDETASSKGADTDDTTKK